MNKQIDYDKDDDNDDRPNDYGTYRLSDAEIAKIVDPAGKAWSEIINA